MGFKITSHFKINFHRTLPNQCIFPMCVPHSLIFPMYQHCSVVEGGDDASDAFDCNDVSDALECRSSLSDTLCIGSLLYRMPCIALDALCIGCLDARQAEGL